MYRLDLTRQGLVEINWNVKNILGAISKNLTNCKSLNFCLCFWTGTALYDLLILLFLLRRTQVLADFKLVYLGWDLGWDLIVSCSRVQIDKCWSVLGNHYFGYCPFDEWGPMSQRLCPYCCGSSKDCIMTICCIPWTHILKHRGTADLDNNWVEPFT